MAKTNVLFNLHGQVFPLIDRFYWLCYSLSGNSFPSNINHEIPVGEKCSCVEDSEDENRA